MLRDRNGELENMRNEYQNTPTTQINSDPVAEFSLWLGEAIRHNELEPTAMSLATVTGDRPRTRIVLLKGIKAEKFVFYTNYESIKGGHLASNQNVAACFWWPTLARQVLIEGYAQKISLEESEKYFASRPLGSKLAALLSKQSQPVTDFTALLAQLEALETKFKDREEQISKPPYWGGYAITPLLIELWKGMPSRLHERIQYLRSSPQEGWQINRLAP